MTNPFEIIDFRLTIIEQLLLEIKYGGQRINAQSVPSEKITTTPLLETSTKSEGGKNG